MSNALAMMNPLGLLDYAAFMMAGFVLMVVGLGLGVTLIMLPVGIMVGLVSVAMFVGGLLGHLDKN